MDETFEGIGVFNPVLDRRAHMEYTDAKQAMKELTMALLYLSRFCEREKFSEAKNFTPGRDTISIY